MIASCSPWIVATMSRDPARPGPLQGRQQRPRAADLQIVAQDRPVSGLPAGFGVGVGLGRRPLFRALSVDHRDESLVLDIDDPRTVGGNVPAEGQPHRIAPGGPVKRLSDRRTPVDDQRLEVVPGHSEPADVKALRHRRPVDGQAIDAAEAEGLVTNVQLLEAGETRPYDYVSFLEVLRCARSFSKHRTETLPGIPPKLLEAIVSTRQVGLLRLELRVSFHSSPFSATHPERPNPRS